MDVVRTVAELRARRSAMPQPVGFVPTMGALHAGHARLLERAREQNAGVVASIFVNPLQFAPDEDYERYPRDFASDTGFLERKNVDVVFAPERDALFGMGFSTSVDVGGLGERFEGESRPAHFRGVATIVAKLLNLVEPQALYLGQKDAQQAAVLMRMVADLNFAPEVRVVETVRDEDGLAYSSRNAYLSAEERAAAPSLYAALREAARVFAAEKNRERAIAAGKECFDERGQLEYLDIVDRATFAPVESTTANCIAIGAARFGATRLIDNVLVSEGTG